MNNTKRQLMGSVAIASLLCAEITLPIAAHAATPEASIRLSQLQPWRQAYECGDFAIELGEEGRDRYSYEAVNARGQKLSLSDGTHHGGRNYSSIYTFNGNDGTQYVLEDFGGGKAALSIGNYPDASVTYDCTTDGNP
ncbi:MAG: hypothetical protein KME15_26685 [Drouetiella hepatica Uher 2000/2452]|jgi:hypothetical protein|uniref:C-type lysozyme inhibitor domain-containing protein n=1 Tax=Drouetiella hepatica Uher 2000/2452 TaxID=904376 RepID=A0A951UPR7_9CYAN|nr:hypothetical protein [Drouetiella hepatica Uher 2000/2452]